MLAVLRRHVCCTASGEVWCLPFVRRGCFSTLWYVDVIDADFYAFLHTTVLDRD
jgi:hypothetical protein